MAQVGGGQGVGRLLAAAPLLPVVLLQVLSVEDQLRGRGGRRLLLLAASEVLHVVVAGLLGLGLLLGPVEALLQHIVHAEGLLQQLLLQPGVPAAGRPHEARAGEGHGGYGGAAADARAAPHRARGRTGAAAAAEAGGAAHPRPRHRGHQEPVVGLRVGAEEVLAELAPGHAAVHIQRVIVLAEAVQRGEALGDGGQRGEARAVVTHWTERLAYFNRRLLFISWLFAAQPSRQTVHHFKV